MGSYGAANWPGFCAERDSVDLVPGQPLSMTPIPHIDADTPDNYAVATSGTASMTLGTANPDGLKSILPFGTLHSFFFACSLPGSLKVPQACMLNVTATCFSDLNASPPTLYTYSSMITYTPAGLFDSNMHAVDYTNIDNPSPSGGVVNNYCREYQFQAVPSEGSASMVALEIDTVIWNAWFRF